MNPRALFHLPLLPLALGLVVGILLAHPAIIMVALIAAFLCFLFGREIVGLSLIMCAVGSAEIVLTEQHLPDEVYGHEMQFSGVIREYRQTERGVSAMVTVDSANRAPVAEFPLWVIIDSSELPIDNAYRIRFRGELERMEHKPRVPYERDRWMLQRRKGMEAYVYCGSEQILGITPEPGVFNALRRQGSRVTQLLVNSGLSDGCSAFLATILAGDNTLLSSDHRDDFANSGLAHIFALSGMHVAIIASIISWLLWPLAMIGEHRMRWLFCCMAIWLFVAMVGATPSVVRAAVMLSMTLIALILGRRYNPLNALCLALIIILVAEPRALFDVGLQLSFSSVLLIVLLAKRLNPFDLDHRGWQRVMSIVLIPVIVFPVAAGLGAWYFHRLPMASVFANVLVSPVIAPMILLGGTVVVCGLFGIPSALLVRLTDGLFSVIDTIARAFSDSVLDNVYISPLTLTVIIAVTVLLVTAFYQKHRRRVMVCLVSACVICIVVGITQIVIKDDQIRTGVWTPDHKEHLVMLALHEDTLRVVTTARRSFHADLLNEMQTRNREMIGRLGIRHVMIAEDTFSLPSIERRGAWLAINGKSHLIASRATEEDINQKADYLIVDPIFIGDTITARADSALVSTALFGPRLRRIERLLARAALPYRSH